MSSKDKGNVIIIGGGVSGVTAAHHLTNEGFNVELYEGRNRKGGRLWTDSSIFNYVVDFGGAFIHGNENNPVYQLARQQNARLLELSWETSSYYSSSLNILSAKDANSKYFAVGESFISYLVEHAKTLGKNDDVPISSVLTAYMANFNLSKELCVYLKNYVAIELEAVYASRIENLSLKSFEALENNERDFLVIDGYWPIFEKLINFKYNLNSTVVEVNQEGIRPYITLSTGEQHEADYIIVTVPLGVLKKSSIAFYPKISRSKQMAISALGFGTTEKIVVEFSNPFWKDTSILKLIEEPVCFFNFSFSLYEVIGKSTLIFVVPGEGKYFEYYYTITEDELKSIFIQNLQCYFPGETIEIKTIFWTKWGEDPFSQGSYTNYKIGSYNNMIQELSQKEGKIHFAGEHTDRLNFETVTGAYLSGLRVFNEVREDYKLNPNY